VKASNANQLTAPASDEFDLVRAWQRCTTSMLSRCISAWRQPCVAASPMNKKPAAGFAGHNLQPGLPERLGALAEAALTCDRMVQF
jgi:tRNA 2-thiouridine synthesizing protein D